MELKDGSVDFYEIKQQSKVANFMPDIPFDEYLYDEALPNG